MNLAWWLETGMWDFPDKAAVINPDGSEISYAELNTLSNQIGNVLRGRFGVRPEDVVVTLAGEDHWHVAVLFALWKIGAVACPLNRTQIYSKFLHDAEITRPVACVVNRQFGETAQRLVEDGAIPQVLALEDGVARFPSLPELARQAPRDLRIEPRANADLALINFTTGTTGPSKGAMLPHGCLITSYVGGVHLSGMRSSEKVLCPLYLFHGGGLSVVLTTLVAHATVILMGEPWSNDRAIDLLEEHRPDWLFLMVPVMTRDLARNPRFQDLDCTGLKVHLAGEPVSPEVQEMWEDRGARTLILYGMTESMAVCVTGSSFYYEDDRRVGKGLTGRPIREFGEVKLIDPISGEIITRPGVRGELCFRGDVLTPGYYNDAERTREAIDEEGWFHTFDLAVRDEDGNFSVGGRTDDIISSGGEKLSLIEVENAILKAPFVRDAACVGVPHERFGHSPAAFVALAEDMDEEEMMRRLEEFLVGHLERWRRPRLYVRLDEIPRSLAKRVKIWPRLREIVDGVRLTGTGAITLGNYRRSQALEGDD